MTRITSLLKWFEIPAFDFDRAVNFYSNVFNVEIERYNFNGEPHGVFSTGTGSVSGAIVKSEKENFDHSGPVLYFSAETDMSSVTEKILESGGKIVKPKTLIKNVIQEGVAIVPKNLIDNQVGYFAMFLDSEGNKMALYSNS